MEFTREGFVKLYKRWDETLPGAIKESLWNQVERYDKALNKKIDAELNPQAETAGVRVVDRPDPALATEMGKNSWAFPYPRPSDNAGAPAAGGLGGFDVNKAIAQARQFTDAIKLGEEPTQEDIMSRYKVMANLPGMSTEIYDKMLKNAEDSARLNFGLAMMRAGFGAAAAAPKPGESKFSTLSRTLFEPLSAAAMQTMGAARKEKMAAQIGKLGAQRGISMAALQAEMSAKGIKDKAVMDLVLKAFGRTRDTILGEPYVILDKDGKRVGMDVVRFASKTHDLIDLHTGKKRPLGTNESIQKLSGHLKATGVDAPALQSGEFRLYDGKELYTTDDGRVPMVRVIGKGENRGKVVDLGTGNIIDVDGEGLDLIKIFKPSAGDARTYQGNLVVVDDKKKGLMKDGKLVQVRLGSDNNYYRVGTDEKYTMPTGYRAMSLADYDQVSKDKTTTGDYVVWNQDKKKHVERGGAPLILGKKGGQFFIPGSSQPFVFSAGERPMTFTAFEALEKEGDPKGILSKEFLQGNYPQAAGALGTDYSDLESVRGPLKTGQLRGTLKVDPKAAVLGQFPFLMPDGTAVPENFQKAIWDSYKGLIWGRAKGAKSYSEFAPIVKAANQEFLNRSIYDMGIPLPSGRPRPEITNRTMAKDAKLASKAPGVNVADQWKNVNITAFKTGDLSKPPAKTGITVQSNPHLFRNITNVVDGERDLQQRFDLEKAGRRLSFSSRNRPDEWWSDLGTTSDKIRDEREARYGSKDATENIKHVQDSLNMLNEIRNFSNAMLATKGATGWIEGNFIDFLESTIGTEWLEKNVDYSRLKVAGDRFISGISRKVGRQFGDLRISNYDAEDYKKMNAAMGKSVTLNKVLLDRYEQQLLNEIRNGLKNIGIADFDKRTLESAISSGVDISGIKPKHGYYSPFFKDTFPLTEQPTPQHEPKYIQELREAGTLKRRRYKGQYLVPEVDSTTGAMIIGKAPLRFSQQQLDALDPTARKRVMGLIEMYWQKGWRELE